EKLGQRCAAQADHQRLARLRVKKQERHHAARVVERERMRIVQAHRALDRLAADVQRAHAARVAHRDRGLALAGAQRSAPSATTTSTSSRSSGCTRLVTPTSVLAGSAPAFRYPERISRNAATFSAFMPTM